MDGLLIIDKPVGPTSHDVVARLRQVLKERRVGHTGTLDPAASGVLALVLGRATRLAQFLSTSDKAYDATVRLGIATDTYDALGQPTGASFPGPWPSRDTVDRALDEFRGTFLQRPPAFSAKMIDGTRSYKLARATRRERDMETRDNRRRSPDPVAVTARTIELVTVEDDRVTLRIICAAGFYVRSLAHDLGERLGTGAHLLSLRRTRVGDATLEHSVELGTIERDPAAAANALVPLAGMLPSLAEVVLTERGVRHAINGRDLGPGDAARGFVAPHSGLARDEGPAVPVVTVRLFDVHGDLVGLGAPAKTPGLLHPAVILM